MFENVCNNYVQYILNIEKVRFSFSFGVIFISQIIMNTKILFIKGKNNIICFLCKEDDELNIFAMFVIYACEEVCKF